MKNKTYECLCGKIFDNPQKFNGHKRQCRIHLINKYGNEETYLQHKREIKQKSDKATEATLIEKRKQQQQIRAFREEQWISEGHKCERCGKTMTEYYGSGRFCSSSCAHSRIHSEETKLKIKNSSLKYAQNNPDKIRANLEKGLLNPDVRKKAAKRRQQKNFKRQDDKIKSEEELFALGIPYVTDEVINRKPGWQNKKIHNSYPEQFWMKVFDNNKIEYIREHKIHNEFSGKKGALYKMDFLINGKIDVEIDGSQHKLTLEKDLRRDRYLTSLGYKIYRIPWVNPYNEKSKEVVAKQISELLNFLSENL